MTMVIKFITASCLALGLDVCIQNLSDQTIYFSVPTIGQNGPLNPPAWVDAWSNTYYSSLFVSINNSYNQNIFNQPVPDHSIIKITPQMSAFYDLYMNK